MRKPLYITAICLLFSGGLTESCRPKKDLQSSTSKKTEVSAEAIEVKFKNLYYNACKENIKGNKEIAENIFSEALLLKPQDAAVKYELSKIYFQGGLLDQAMRFAREAAKAAPSNEWYQLHFVECLNRKKMYNEAVETLEKLIKIYPQKELFFDMLADELQLAGKIEKSLDIYGKMEKKFGRSEEVSISKIKVLRYLNRSSEAEAELKLLISEYPHEPNYYTMLADFYQESGHFEKAFSTYQEILQKDPNNPYIRLALADYYRIQHKEEDFFRELKIAYKNPDLDIDAKVKILISYYNLTETRKEYLSHAYELCELMLGSSPNEPKAHSVYADFLFRDKKYSEARTQLLLVTQLEKGKYPIWSQLMICDSELNDYHSLRDHSYTCMDLFPNQAIPYYLNGVAQIKLKNYKEAITSLQDGIEFVYENDPLTAQFHVNLGEAYHAVKDHDKSDEHFDQALIVERDNASLLNNYAYYLSLRKEKLEKAETLIQHALQIEPESPSFIDTYAWILYQQKKYEDAKIWLEKAIKSGGDKRPAVLEHYGDVLFHHGDIQGAVEYWRKALDNGGNSETLLKKIKDKHPHD